MFGTTIDSKPSLPVGDLIEELISAYKLADELLICALKNAVIDAGLQNQKDRNRAISLTTVVKLWDMQLSDTQLFRMALRSHVRNMVKNSGKRELHDYGGNTKIYSRSSLLKQVFESTYECLSTKWTAVYNEPWCTYHDHFDGSRCDKNSG